MKSKIKVAWVVSHPIQHFCPQYASLAQHTDFSVKVFFGSTRGLKQYIDPNFGQAISWGNLYLDEFDHVFLNGEGNDLSPDASLDAPGLEAALEEFAPDIVVVYGYFQALQRRARKWGLRRGVPMAYISDAESRQHRSWWKQALKWPYLFRYFRPFTWFLTVGDANEAYYRSYGVPGNKLVRMHFPIDIKTYSSAFANKQQLRSIIRHRFGIREEDKVISVVGKLVPWKCQDHLIAALKHMPLHGARIHAFIIGSGEQLEAWKEKAREVEYHKVHFTGFVNTSELPSYYAATDLYVHPAMIEPHSLAISEALYMGCPSLISSRCGSYGPSDDVRSGYNGEVYSFGDIPVLAEAIALLLTDTKKLALYGDRCREMATKQQRLSHGGFLEALASNKQ